MKIWTTEHVFNHPWETVTQAVWRKYPNPHKPEVLATDVIERRVENGVLFSKRLISTRWGLPDWAKRLIGTDKICYAYESSEVNPTEQKMIMRSRNLTLSNTVSLDETLEYTSDPDDSNKTILKQETIITVKGVPLTSYIEGYLLSCINRNSFKGREAMEWIICKINVEVEELMFSYKRSTTELIHSIEEIKDSAKKSIGDISHVALKGIDEFQNLAKPASSLPRV